VKELAGCDRKPSQELVRYLEVQAALSTCLTNRDQGLLLPNSSRPGWGRLGPVHLTPLLLLQKNHDTRM